MQQRCGCELEVRVVQYVLLHARHPLNTLCVQYNRLLKKKMWPNILLCWTPFLSILHQNLPLELYLIKIAVDAGINIRPRHFVCVVCNGLAISLLWQLIIEEPQNYPRVITITGLGHEEMKMVEVLYENVFWFNLVGIFRNSRLFYPKFICICQPLLWPPHSVW